MIGGHINAYSTKDPIQVLGGGIPGSMILGGILGGVPGLIRGGINPGMEFGPAGRTFEGAKNINATVDEPYSAFRAHTGLWVNPNAWSMINGQF